MKSAVVTFLAIAILSLLWVAEASAARPPVFPGAQGTYYTGVYPGAYNGWEDSPTPTLLQAYQNAVGKQASFVMFTHEWARTRAFPAAMVSWIDSMGSVPYIRLGMRSRVDLRDQADTVYSLQHIIDGQFDADLHAWARGAKAFGKTILAEYGIECNGGVMSWSAVYNGGDTLNGYGDPTQADGPERFRDAYKHIIQICRDEGATNVYWFLHGVDYCEPHEAWNLLSQYYPGDDWIDGLGVSIYGAKNPMDTDCGRSFKDVMDNAYSQMVAISPNKPVAVLEVAITGGNLTCPGEQYCDSMFVNVLNGRWPNLRAISWWNEKYDVHAWPVPCDFWVQDDAGLQNAFHTYERDRSNMLARFPSMVSVNLPNGGESYATGSTQTITWTSRCLAEQVKIELNRSYPSSTWETVVASTANTGQYAWSVSGTATTAARIRISGTLHPAVCDTSDTSFSITGGSGPTLSLAVSAPNGGESYATGSNQTISWTSANMSTEPVKIELNRSYPSATWETITSSTANSGTYSWAVSGTATTAARVRITGTTHTTVGDTSNANFSITAAPPPASLTVSAPNGGESWTVGSSHPVTWSSSNFTGAVTIELNRSYPSSTWETVASGISNNGSYSWAVSGAASSVARIRVRGTTQTTVDDTSNANFSITAAASASITVLSPNGGENARIGNYYQVRWTSAGLPVGSTVLIQLNRNYPYGAWETLNYSAANSGSYYWAPSGTKTYYARIRITSNASPTVSDMSNANFTISNGWYGSGGGDVSAELPTETKLDAAFPNPFNPTTQIRFELTEATHVRLDVFDITGRLVTTLLDAQQEGGVHNVTFDGRNLASGLYLVRMSAGAVTNVQKIQLMK